MTLTEVDCLLEIWRLMQEGEKKNPPAHAGDWSCDKYYVTLVTFCQPNQTWSFILNFPSCSWRFYDLLLAFGTPSWKGQERKLRAIHHCRTSRVNLFVFFVHETRHTVVLIANCCVGSCYLMDDSMSYFPSLVMMNRDVVSVDNNNYTKPVLGSHRAFVWINVFDSHSVPDLRGGTSTFFF